MEKKISKRKEDLFTLKLIRINYKSYKDYLNFIKPLSRNITIDLTPSLKTD